MDQGSLVKINRLINPLSFLLDGELLSRRSTALGKGLLKSRGCSHPGFSAVLAGSIAISWVCSHSSSEHFVCSFISKGRRKKNIKNIQEAKAIGGGEGERKAIYEKNFFYCGLTARRKNKSNLKGLYNGGSSLYVEIATSVRNKIPFWFPL